MNAAQTKRIRPTAAGVGVRCRGRARVAAAPTGLWPNRSYRTAIKRGGGRRWRRAVSLVEVMITVAITAALFVAVGTATIAGGDAVVANDELVTHARQSRAAIDTLLREVRTADACRVGTVAQQSAATVTADTLLITTSDGHTKAFAFDAAGRRVTVAVDGATPRTLIRGVRSTTFCSVVNTGATGDRVTASVSVTLTFDPLAADTPARASGSAVVRRQLP